MNVSFRRRIIECAGLLFLLMTMMLTDDKEREDTEISGIYERFLNGELTVAYKEEQVSVGELFWDNDIAYCFYDIDGDGEEELHVRDSAAYYIVKICDELPQIIFEGWWGYEPVVADGQCGILHYYYGYGSEELAFQTIDADGNKKSEGTFYWFDDNHNGNIDEGDSFIGLGCGDMEEGGMEQYVRYREEQLAKLAGNGLEWTDKQLKKFSTWQEAYADFIKKTDVMDMVSEEYGEYSLIYVDEDEIPELYIGTGWMPTGEFVVSFYKGNIGVLNRGRVGLQYVEHGGLLYAATGNTGFYPCNIYQLKKGKFSEIGTGWYSERFDGETIYEDYFWEDSPVTEAAYQAYIEELIDTANCVEPSVLFTKEEILKMLEEK